MTELSREILENWQVRKTKKQKTAFIAFLRSHFPELRVEEGGLAGSRNLVLGDVESAELVLGAHYDTCAVMPIPNFLTPKNFLLYLGYNLLIIVPFFLVAGFLGYGLTRLGFSFQEVYFLVLALYIGFILLLLVGPANRHTANDNTSGVVTLCEIYTAMSEEQRRRVAVVFFDLEEAGLIGSSQFRKVHKAAMQNRLLINFDCVSDGDHLLVIANKQARASHDAVLREAFAQTEDGKTVYFEKTGTTIYPSDQTGFPCAVAVSAFQKKPVIGLYMSRIHTRRDTVMDERNITYLVQSVLKLLKQAKPIEV